jgi:DNA-binding PadR family transcriptional regulator
MNQSRTNYVILGLLSIEPNLSGYDIRKAIESSVGYFWSESYGQIYPALKRLTTEGLITPSRSTSKPRQRRQEYSLTDAGRASLQAWLAQPFQNDPPRNEFLLKLFFGREAPPSVSIGHVRELQERNRRSLATMLEIKRFARSQSSQNPHQPFWMLTLSLGIAMTRAALEWGDSALNELSSMETPNPARSQKADARHAAKES